MLSHLAYTIGHSPSPQPGRRSLFLGYARHDRPDVDQLYDALHQCDPMLPLFQDHRTIQAGQPWLDVLRQRLGTASLLVCWLTSAYVTSTFCHYEVGVAESTGARIIPVLVDAGIAGRLPAYLSRLQAITPGLPLDYAALVAQLIGLLP